MVQLGADTWLRYGIWMLVGKNIILLERFREILFSQLLNCNDPSLLSPGLLIYFCYGIWFSVQRYRGWSNQVNDATISSKVDESKTNVINEEKFWARVEQRDTDSDVTMSNRSKCVDRHMCWPVSQVFSLSVSVRVTGAQWRQMDRWASLFHTDIYFMLYIYIAIIEMLPDIFFQMFKT